MNKYLEKFIKKAEKGDCNHDLGDINNTLIVSNHRNMTSPEEIHCVCKNCQKSFKFIKTGLGTYVQV